MQKIATIAVIISSFSLIIAAIGCVITFKTFRKSKKLEFFQRRDHLFAKVSDLNSKTSETYLIETQYEILKMKKYSLQLPKDQAQVNIAQMKSIATLLDKLEQVRNNGAKILDNLHYICGTLTAEADAATIEFLITLVQNQSDDTSHANEVLRGFLGILEEPNSMVHFDIEEAEKKIGQIDPALIRTMKKLEPKNEPSD